MKPTSDEEAMDDIEFLRELLSDPARFDEWANSLLDRAHGHSVERSSGR